MDQQVARAGADAEAGVVADRRVGRVQRQEEVGHHGPVPQRGLKRGRTQGLAANRPVDVGNAEQDEFLIGSAGAWFALHGGPRLLGGAHSFAFTALSTARIVSAKRSIISFSSSSVLVKAGASSTSSPA